jgi:hypothetical protein
MEKERGRETNRERERGRERERERERERGRERYVEYVQKKLIFKRSEGALAPFSYLVYYKMV